MLRRRHLFRPIKLCHQTRFCRQFDRDFGMVKVKNIDMNIDLLNLVIQSDLIERLHRPQLAMDQIEHDLESFVRTGNNFSITFNKLFN
jgi:hypothetical protein